MPKHILIVEDELKIANLLENYFQASHFQTTTIDEGTRVIDWVRHHEPAMIVLDLMLPGKDGIDICHEIRQFSNVPIIMITARVEEIDRIIGLEIGADDYICKPFSPREVVARVKAIFRRLDPLPNNEQIEKLPLFLDEETYIANFNQTQLDLTPVEFRLLIFLHNMPGKVFSREQLMNALYEDHRIVTDRTIDSHIRNLRKKLHNAGCTDEVIHSVYGVGYKYEL